MREGVSYEARGGVVKHESARQRHAAAEHLLQLVTQLHRTERVKAGVHQRSVGIDCSTGHAVHDR